MSVAAPEKVKLSQWGIVNPIPVALLFIALTILGAAAYSVLPIKNFPDVTFPTVVVTVTQSGAAPAEMENQVTRPVEDAMAGIAGVKHIISTVVTGVSTTQVEFEIGSDQQKAVDDIRAAVDRVRINLPAGIDPPMVSRVDFDSIPIMTFAVEAPSMSVQELSWFIDNTVARAIQGRDGVGQVTRLGGANREINVTLDPQRMAAFRVTAPEINAALLQYANDASGGRASVGDREATVRVLGGPADAAAIRDLTVPLQGGRFVRLADVAEVGDGVAEVRGFARLNGRPVVAFQVAKSKGSSEVAVEKAINRGVEELRKAHPDVTVTEVLSTVRDTRASFHATQAGLIEGMILAALVVFAFLRDWRATSIAAIAMPLSLIPTFATMAILGFSLNVVTLLALTLVIGILVDDAIVEIENIQKRIERGQRPFEAAMAGADAIGLAVVATTLTIVAVFTPVSFLNSLVGQFFKEFGLTVSMAVLFSLLVARLLTPLMAAYLLKPSVKAHPPRPMPRYYKRSLDWAMSHRWLSALFGGVFFIASMGLTAFIPQGFQPTEDLGYLYLQIQGPPGATREDMERAVAGATEVVMKRPDADKVFAQIGAGMAGMSSESGEPTEGLITVVLKDRRKLTTNEFKLDIRRDLRNIPDARVATFGGFAGAEVEVILSSQDNEALQRAQTQLLREMRTLTEISDPRPAPPPASAELVVRPRPAEAARLGVTADALASVTRVATIGDIDANVAKLSEGERRIPIRVRLADDARSDLSTIEQLQVPTGMGGTTTLSTVADVSFDAGPGRIVRYDRERRASVQADLNETTLGQALGAADKLPIMQNLPPGVRKVTQGDAEAMIDLFTGIIFAMLGGIGLIYAVMVLLFRSFFKPIIILSALPLSMGGAFVGLLLVGLDMTMPVMIGLLMLLGLSAKNSILLVELAIEEERAGKNRWDAIHEACRERARPIVMTSVAMSAGMLPTALGIGEGSEWRQPMAVAVIGGLFSSTVLSLVLVPVVYLFVDDVERWIKPRLARFITPREAAPAE